MRKRRLVALVALAILVASCAGSSEPVEIVEPSATSPAATEAEDQPAQASAAEASSEAEGLTGVVAIVDVDVFDGVELLPQVTVIIENGLIAAVGSAVEIPAGAQIVEGEGQTLLPGLIDSHTHSLDNNALARAVDFGVTTHLDMFTDPRFLSSDLAAERSNPARPQADMFSSGVLGTAAGGHGTQFNVEIPTMDSPDDVPEWVQGRIDEGASFIKLVIEDGAGWGTRIPTLDEPTFAAAVEESASNDLLVVTHVSTLEDATTAISNGSNGLAHLFVDEAPGDAFVELMVDQGAFMVPTMVVLSGGSDDPSGRSVIEDPDLGPRLNELEVSILEGRFPLGRQRIDAMLEAVSDLHQAGVPILAGSDAPNTGTFYGVSMHREIEFFTQAGMTEIEALASATSVPAEIFGLDDRGRIAPGLVADLLLVNGDPTTDITATRSIVAVWKDGIPIPID